MTIPLGQRVSVTVPLVAWRLVDRQLDVACAPVVAAAESTAIEVGETPRGRPCLWVTALPAAVDPGRYLERVADLVRYGELVGVTDLSDHGDDAVAVRLTIVLRSDGDLAEVRRVLLSTAERVLVEAGDLAREIRRQLRSQIPLVGGDDAAGDELATVALSREHWKFLTSELARRFPDDAGDDPEAEPSVETTVVGAISTALFGPVIDDSPGWSSTTRSGLDWVVTLDGRALEPRIWLTLSRDGRALGKSGIELAPRGGRSRLSGMTSQYDDELVVMMVVVDAAIDNVVITPADGTEVTVPLSEPDDLLNRRVAVESLPAGQLTAVVRAETAGVVVDQLP